MCAGAATVGGEHLMMHWTTRKALEDHDRDRIAAMAALAGYRITEWRGPNSTCWEVSDPTGFCWAKSFATRHMAALAVCRNMGINI